MTERPRTGEDRLVAAIADARATGSYEALLGAVPYAQFMNFSIDRLEGELVTTMRYESYLVGNASLPALHGGTTGSLLESASIFMLMLEHELSVLPKTVTITFEFLRSARAKDTHAAAEITRIGRRVAAVRSTAWQDDRERPVASASGHFLIAD